MKVGVFWVAVLLVVVAAWIPLSHCSKKPVGVARKEDIPYTKCQVCQKLAKELYQQVQNKQGVNAKQLSEPVRSSKPDLDSLLNYLCKDLTKACSTKPPPVPKVLLPAVWDNFCDHHCDLDRTPGEPSVAKSSKEAEMEKLLKSMEGTPGAPGMKMYSREDLMNMKNFDGKDVDDEDEDDEASFPSKLGKVLRAKESGKRDWKQMIKKGIKDTSVTLKKHANRVSNHMRQWWRGKKATTSKKG